ncbi:MAG: HAMP domain-containing sensor histidine kinase [Clostridium sp.]|nr:HAMP domain-containing sensor histidine kinase [Clostridium sp.]
MLTKKIYSIDSRRIILIAIINIICFYALFKLNIFIANKTNFYNLIIVRDIVGINLVIGFLSIFSFFLYSYLYNDDYFHMFALMYVSIYFEFSFMSFFAYNLDVFHLMDVNKAFIGFASIFRTVIICLTYYDENPVNRYLHKHQIIGFMLSILITLGCILSDVYLMKHDLINSSMYLIKAIKLIVNIVTYTALIGFCIQYVHKRNINYFITFMGTLIMFLSRVLLIQELYPTKHTMYLLNRVVLGWGFAIIVISMFTEILIKAKENKQLTDEVITQKIQMNNLKHEEELRNQFFANISHELRTPLNILICSFELLKANVDDKDKLYEYYKKYDNTITDNSSRMLRLINNIIDASKFDSGLLKMNFVNCEIISIIENITMSTIQSPKLQDRNIVFDTNTEYLEIKCDVENIERVILNLLSNAIKFTDSDGNVKVECIEERDTFKISVKDDGIGIPEEYRKKIFERFVQVDKTLSRNV